MKLVGSEDERFRRLGGVKHSQFEKMISILKEADIKKKRILNHNVRLETLDISNEQRNIAIFCMANI